jgi:hypothetical protein
LEWHWRILTLKLILFNTLQYSLQRCQLLHCCVILLQNPQPLLLNLLRSTSIKFISLDVCALFHFWGRKRNPNCRAASVL